MVGIDNLAKKSSWAEPGSLGQSPRKWMFFQARMVVSVPHRLPGVTERDWGGCVSTYGQPRESKQAADSGWTVCQQFQRKDYRRKSQALGEPESCL